MLLPRRVYTAQNKHGEAVRASTSADSQAPLVSWLARIMDCKSRIQKLVQEPKAPGVQRPDIPLADLRKSLLWDSNPRPPAY